LTDFDEDLYKDFVQCIENLYSSTESFLNYSEEVGSISKEYSEEAMLKSFSHMVDMHRHRQELEEFLDSLPIEAEDASEVLDETSYFNGGVSFSDPEGLEEEGAHAAARALTSSYEELRAYSFLVNGEELFIDLPDLTPQNKQEL
jgi:hypothetical protein